MRVVYTVLSNNRHGQDMDMLDVEKFGAGGLRWRYLFRFFLRLLGTCTSSAVGDQQ